MGFVGSLIGGAGGANGTGFAAPSSASIATPTTGTQVSNAYGASQTALQQQQAFLQAVQAQNGLNNQTNVYNQLQGVANGTGPNPAQAQLAQATGANVANQAALMAGQRGAGANVGLIARQSAQQGAATQQQAAGQAASMQAQQSLNALSGMGNLATSQANQLAQATGANTGATQSEQQTLLNAIAQQNNAQVGMQSNINSANATLGAAQMTAQNNLLGNIMGSVGSAALLGGGASAASGGAGAAGAAGAAGGGGATLMAGGAGDAVVSGGALDAVGSGLADAAPLLALAAKGGEVKGYDSGGVVGDQSPLQQSIQPVQPSQPTGPQSQVGKTLASQNWNLGSGKPDSSQAQGTGQIGSTIGKLIGKGIYSMFGPSQQAQQDPYGMGNRIGETTNETAQDIAELPNSPSDQKPVYSSNDDGEVLAPEQTDMAKGGKVPAMVSPGERYLSPEESKMAAKGANPMKLGEKIPGKPKVGGAQNNYANDTVPKTLEEGGLVLPRSVTQAKNPAKEAHKFVAAIMAKNGKIAKR